MDPEHSSLAPEKFDIAQPLIWDARWIDVNLYAAVGVSVNGHTYPITRQVAQRSVDAGRWILNWLENESNQEHVRETFAG